jgi:hypothetical protein
MMSHMDAVLVYSDRVLFDDGAILAATIWRVPTRVLPSTHSFKYRLFYGYPGQRVIGYDNERGKGDHRHLHGAEQPYEFVSVEKLMQDFLADVAHERGST